ncbi:metal ABC transporter solute-binding protein, Zn/Mn family [Guptibacillus algicola]|uniref:metal ABC transporter solute-binding protein, Zn/Mn family n=1 Tax=Guptibacillus algicola TaxID=225844 RepID=UPI001CD72326|nr:zinc ABC transporter substrate-binding protein [Alkalihalobacillus algicola]MCA0989271.1 zinc ABC transporter substrate-binding protein [Alkalihalobacillus algicola]
MKRYVVVAFVLSLFTFLLVGCASDSDSNETSEDKLVIYTTLYPTEYFAERIGGDAVEAKSIIPPGSDAHSFDPTTRTMTELAESDLFIFNGAGLEGFADTAKDILQKEGVTTLEASDGIDLAGTEEGHEEHDEGEGDHEHEHEHGNVDPHVWIDPVFAIEQARNIKDSLIELRPDQENEFESNFEKLEDDLLEIDQSFKTMVSNAEKNEFLISHDAYGYWEKRYGLEQLSVTGLSPSQEPTQQQLEEIIETAKNYDLSYMIFEQNVTPKPAKTVQKELGLETLRIHNLSVLSEEDIENDVDYISLMKQNIETLEKALNE